MIVGFREALSHWQLVAAWSIFLASYFVFAFGRLPGTRIDRPAMAVVGAVLMFVCRIVSPRSAIESVDFSTLVLLFAMMLIVASLHLAGFFDWVANRVIVHLSSRQLLPGVVFTSGVLSAFLVNGGVATITGNPQNILIGTVSGIGYRHFLAHLGPVAAIGLLIDWALIHWIYMNGKVNVTDLSPSPATDLTVNAPANLRLLWPIIVTVGVLAGFFFGFPPPLVAAAGGALLLYCRA